MGLLDTEMGAEEAVTPPEEEMIPIPEELLQTSIKGAEALFYTSVQVLDTPDLEEIIMGQLESADLSEATQVTMDQAVKVHVQQRVPVTSPMVIAATNYVAMYLAEVAKGRGVEFDEGDIRGATFDYVDYHLAEVAGGRLLEVQQANDESGSPADPAAMGAPPGGPGPEMGAPPGGGDPAMGADPGMAQGLTGGM
jgi:hypothetical protein